MSGQELTGRWWVPPKSDLDETGVLRIGMKGDLELALNGTLGRLDAFPNAAKSRVPVVWGVTRTQQLVTLLDVARTDWHIAAPGYPTETFRPEAALVGALLGPDDLSCSRVGVSFPGLHQWLGQSGLRETVGPKVRDWRIAVDPPHVDTLTLADGTDVTIDFTYRTDRTTVGRLGIDESIFVTFRPKHRSPIDEILRPVSQLRDLLIISCGQALMPVSVRLYCPTRLGAPDTADDPDQTPITFYRATIHPDVDTTQAGERLDFLVTAPQHPKGVAGAIDSWFALYGHHSAAINIISGLHYAPQVLRDPELLLALIVAEAYHRASSFPQAVAREDLKRWHALISVTPPPHLGWLKDFVAQLEEPSLNRR